MRDQKNRDIRAWMGEEQMPHRPDDPVEVMKHAGRYKGGIALAVLGGPSGKEWERLRQEIHPDVILGANGVNSVIRNLPYWMCPENMQYAHRHRADDPYWQEIMDMFHRDTGAKVRMINFKNWRLMENTSNCIRIKRKGYPEGEWPESFSLRDYGEGFMSGWTWSQPDKHIPQQVGTTGAQMLHLAGILGCREVHTIGFELTGTEHFYRYPQYHPDHFRRHANFVEYKGVSTQAVWLEGARFLQYMLPYFDRDGLQWFDHSGGLFKLMGMKCAV